MLYFCTSICCCAGRCRLLAGCGVRCRRFAGGERATRPHKHTLLLRRRRRQLLCIVHASCLVSYAKICPPALHICTSTVLAPCCHVFLLCCPVACSSAGSTCTPDTGCMCASYTVSFVRQVSHALLLCLPFVLFPLPAALLGAPAHGTLDACAPGKCTLCLSEMQLEPPSNCFPTYDDSLLGLGTCCRCCCLPDAVLFSVSLWPMCACVLLFFSLR
jgi:hypothetical protein